MGVTYTLGDYSVIQWLFSFYFYCFFGWCFESAYVSTKSKKFINRGFMKGPFLPLYGSGGIMMLLVGYPFRAHWWLVYIAGCVGATALEYVTGVCMEALFKVRYWDYSYKKIQFQGHICLTSTLAWGGLTLFMIYILHNPVDRFIHLIPANLLLVLTLVLTVYIVADLTISFKAALDLKHLLMRMEEFKKDMARMQVRLDAMIAFYGETIGDTRDTFVEGLEQKRDAIAEGFTQKRDAIAEGFTQKRDAIAEGITQKRDAIAEGITQKWDDLRNGLEDRFAMVKELILRHPEKSDPEKNQELLELSAEYKAKKEHHELGTTLRQIGRRIRNNPGMSSSQYKSAFEELKKKADEWIHRGDK